MAQGRPPSDDERRDIERLKKHPITREVAEEFAKDAQDVAPKPPEQKKKKKRS